LLHLFAYCLTETVTYFATPCAEVLEVLVSFFFLHLACSDKKKNTDQKLI